MLCDYIRKYVAKTSHSHFLLSDMTIGERKILINIFGFFIYISNTEQFRTNFTSVTLIFKIITFVSDVCVISWDEIINFYIPILFFGMFCFSKKKIDSSLWATVFPGTITNKEGFKFVG